MKASMLVLCAVASWFVPAASADLFFKKETFEIVNSVAAESFFVRLGTPGTAVVDDTVQAFNSELNYGYSISTTQTDLGPGRVGITIELIHEDYSTGAGDFYPAGFEVEGQPLLHRVFGFGGSQQPAALLAEVRLALDLLRFETFGHDGMSETQIDNIVLIDKPTLWTGGIGYWNPPPGKTVGSGIVRIVWTAEFSEIPKREQGKQQIDTYGNTKSREYRQVSAAQPSAPISYSYNHYLFSWEEDLSFENVGTVQVDRPDGGVESQPASGGAFAVIYGGFFESEAELDQALPEGLYDFSISGGKFGEQDGSVIQPDFNPWNGVPYVLNYADVQSAQPGRDLWVDYNDWTPDSRTTPDRSPIFWGLFSRDTSQTVISGVQSPNDESEFTIPGSLLVPGTYELSILFSARIEEFPAGFRGAVATTGFDTATRFDFVVPEPSSSDCDYDWQTGDGFLGFDGPVNAMTTWDPDGPGPTTPKLVVGGRFLTLAGGVSANRIALFDPDTGAWSTLGSGMNAPVLALTTLPNGDLIAGGGFTRAGGVPANRIARWNGTAWSALGSGMNDGVIALTKLPNGNLIAGGFFTQAGGVTANRIARWNGTAWSALGSGMETDVSALTVLPNGDLVAGGRFTTAGGVTVNHIARWDGTTWTAFGSGMDLLVEALTTLPNGDLVAGGTFTMAAGVPANRIARWDGTAWTAFGSGMNTGVFSLTTLPNGDLVAGGSFTRAGGVPVDRIARWDGTAWFALGSGVNSFVSDLETLPNGDLVAGGDFTIAGGRPAAYWARWGPRGLRGDSNGDRRINFDDINCFVVALTAPESWSACGTSNPPETYTCVNDINGDGEVDMFDIEGFVSCLALGACP